MAEKFNIYKFLDTETDINEVKKLLFNTYNIMNTSANKVDIYEFYLRMFNLSVNFEKFENPKVSIVIPVKNEFFMTQFLLNSIYGRTHNIPYEIIIADDNSTDETINIQNIFGNITVAKNDINTPGFAYNVINAIKHAKGEYILLLNNDMFVLDNYLNELLNVIENHDDIGIAGAKTISLDNVTIECGVKMYNDASIEFIGEDEDTNYMDDKEYVECDYSSGCSILFKKELWEKSGGFDLNLAPAYFEDSDFAFNLKYNFGLKTVCVPKSKIYHFRGITYNKTFVDKIKTSNKNKEYFLKKWNNQLKNL